MAACDYRVQCGRCTDEVEREYCTDLWLAFGVLYGVTGAFIVFQNNHKSMERKPKLLKRVLTLWGVACLFRVVGAVVMVGHFDTEIHPIILEMMWHTVWLCGCFALTYFIIVLLNAILGITGRSLFETLPIFKMTTAINAAWACLFIAISIYDGLREDWPQPALQWFVWDLCAIYLCFGTGYGVWKLNTLTGADGTNETMNMLMFFGYIIVVGLFMYSLFLPALGIMRVAFNGSYTTVAEVIIFCFHQTGMLCMGIGMQMGITQIKELISRISKRSRDRSGGSRASKGSEMMASFPASKKSLGSEFKSFQLERKKSSRLAVQRQNTKGKSRQALNNVSGNSTNTANTVFLSGTPNEVSPDKSPHAMQSVSQRSVSPSSYHPQPLESRRSPPSYRRTSRISEVPDLEGPPPPPPPRKDKETKNKNIDIQLPENEKDHDVALMDEIKMDMARVLAEEKARLAAVEQPKKEEEGRQREGERRTISEAPDLEGPPPPPPPRKDKGTKKNLDKMTDVHLQENETEHDVALMDEIKMDMARVLAEEKARLAAEEQKKKEEEERQRQREEERRKMAALMGFDAAEHEHL